MDLPDKVYFRIGEVATLLGVQPHVVRFWQQQFPSVKPERSKTGRFLYTRNTVEQLAFIQRLLKSEGYTIAGAKKALRERGTTGKKRAKAAGDGATPQDSAANKVDHKTAAADAAELKKLKGEAAKVTSGVAKLNAEVAKLNAEVAKLNGEAAKLQQQLAAAQSERDSARSQLLALKKLVRREVTAADAVVATLSELPERR